MATFVLVPGFWLGGWAWRDVTAALRGAGHQVHPVTLTGMGDRVHLATEQTDLTTHVTDVVNAIVYSGARQVVVVGHSYGGAGPVTMAAELVPERIAQLIYLDSGPLPDGTGQLDGAPPPVREFIHRRVAERGDGWRYPMPGFAEIESITGASIEGLGEAERAAMVGRATPQPLGTLTQPVRRGSGSGAERIARTLVSCSFPLATVRELIAAGHPWFAELAGPRWRLRELRTGHWPMFSRPADTAALLAALVA